MDESPSSRRLRMPLGAPTAPGVRTVFWLGLFSTLLLVLGVVAVLSDRDAVGAALLVASLLIGVFLWGAVVTRRRRP